MSRKLVTLFLALALALSVAPAMTATAEEEIPTIDWYFGQVDMDDCELVNEAVNEYLEEKIGVHVNLHYWAGSENWEKMTTMISAGQDVGIIGFGSQTILDYVINSQRGAYYPLDDLLEEYGQGTKALFDDEIWDAMTIDGHIYGIPSKKDNGYFISLIYNKTMTEELGIDINSFELKNWSDVEAYAYTVKELRDAAHPEMADSPVLWSTDRLHPYNFAIENFLNDSFYAVCNLPEIMQLDGYDTETVFNLYSTPEFLTYAQNKQKAVEDGIYLYDYTDKSELLYQGDVWGMIGWGYTYGQSNLFGDAVETDIRMFEYMWTDTNNYFSAGTAISSQCANPEAAMKVLELVNTDSYFATMMRFGIEGVHWTTDADGKMTFEGTKNEDSSNRAYYHWYMAPVGNLLIVNAPESLTGPDGIMLTNMAKYNEECIKAAHMGFTFDQSAVANEVAALANVESQYKGELIGGQLSDADEVAEMIEEFNAKLTENGVETVIAEVQSQIDAWKAAKEG